MKTLKLSGNMIELSFNPHKSVTVKTSQRNAFEVKVQFIELSGTIDVFEGSGHTYQQADTAKINISFADGKQWDGTFEQLKKLMFKS